MCASDDKYVNSTPNEDFVENGTVSKELVVWLDSAYNTTLGMKKESTFDSIFPNPKVIILDDNQCEELVIPIDSMCDPYIEIVTYENSLKNGISIPELVIPLDTELSDFMIPLDSDSSDFIIPLDSQTETSTPSNEVSSWRV